MPTIVTKKIGTSNTPVTMDYSTLQAWEDALPADLTSSDTQEIGECYNQGTFTASLTISGQTTDATRTIILRCATGASFSHQDHTTYVVTLSTALVILQAASGVALTIGTANVLVTGMQLQSSASGYTIALAASGAPSNVILERSILWGASASFYAIQPLGTGWTLRNCVLMGNAGALDNSQAELYFCTVIRTFTAGGTFANSSYNNLKAVNCAIFNWTTFLGSGTLRAGSGYNGSDLANVGGNTGDVTSLTYADQLEAGMNDVRLKAGHDLRAGTPVGGITTDIMGFTRDATTPCIGCWEAGQGIGTAFPTTSQARFSYHLRRKQRFLVQ